MSRDIPQISVDPGEEDRALDAQVIASLSTLAAILIFVAGVAFGLWVSR